MKAICCVATEAASHRSEPINMNLILLTIKDCDFARPLWVEVYITESWLNHTKHLMFSASSLGSVTVEAVGKWHPRTGYSEFKLQAVCKSNRVRFRLVGDVNGRRVLTSGIDIRTLDQLNQRYGASETVFYSKDVPVLMAIYYSTKRLEVFK